jgi:hypothetical protein
MPSRVLASVVATNDGQKKEGETVSRGQSREIGGSQCTWNSARHSPGGFVQTEAGEA